MSLLNTLSNDAKVALIDALTKSLSVRREPSSLQSLYGVWKDDRTAEEVIAGIRESRITGTRNIESLA